MSNITTKQEFMNAAMAELSKHEALAARVATGDQTIIQMFGAMAQMMHMVSYQLGIAETEMWEKTRDNIVLADMAMKGVLPYATPSRYNAIFQNEGTARVRISSGRRLLDSQGRVWTVVDGGYIEPNQSATFKIEQVWRKSFTHAVTEQKDFYKIKLPRPTQQGYLCGISVIDSVLGETLKYNHAFANIEVGEPCYHVKLDDVNDMFVEFGVIDVAGLVPDVPDEFQIDISYTLGDVVLENGTLFSLEYLGAGEELVSITSSTALNLGKPPRNIAEMREIAKYPPLYDKNAVYLGEFEFVVRQNIRGFSFLSVWNEQREEEVRGANINNINVLNVAFVNDSYSLFEMQDKIKQVIARADSSYKVRFFNVVEKAIPITVKLRLANIYDEQAVKQKIIDWLLNKYGRSSEFAKVGDRRINWQSTVMGLRSAIPELRDGVSDISIIAEEEGSRLPETFRYLTDASISITNTPLDSNGSYNY